MDATDLEQDRRREVLRAWVLANGGHQAVVSKRRLSPSQASYLSQVVNGYSFGPRAARAMEQRLGMPARHLEGADADHVAAAPEDLAGALDRVLDAVAGATDTQRDELAQVLALLAKTGAAAYKQRAEELLVKAPAGVSVSERKKSA
jgi:hypothetical protein